MSGDSQNWQSRKNSAYQLWNSFAGSPGMEEETAEDAAARNTVTRSWDNLTETTLCDTAPYDSFAKYLIHSKIPTGRMNSGEHYGVDTAITTLCILINRAKEKFCANGTSDTKLFFTCLDTCANTDYACWLRRLKKKIRRIIFQRCLEEGTPMDHSASPLYIHHIEAILASLEKEVSPDSQKRRTAIIHSWQITGRSGESATITLDAMAWDSLYQCLTAEVLQPKVIDC